MFNLSEYNNKLLQIYFFNNKLNEKSIQILCQKINQFTPVL